MLDPPTKLEVERAFGKKYSFPKATQDMASTLLASPDKVGMYKNILKNTEDYDYNKPGALAYGYRVPDNLFGKTLKSALRHNSSVNKDMAEHIKKSRHHSVMRRKLSPLHRDKPMQASL